jgi:hypothetical protein
MAENKPVILCVEDDQDLLEAMRRRAGGERLSMMVGGHAAAQQDLAKLQGERTPDWSS